MTCCSTTESAPESKSVSMSEAKSPRRKGARLTTSPLRELICFRFPRIQAGQNPRSAHVVFVGFLSRALPPQIRINVRGKEPALKRFLPCFRFPRIQAGPKPRSAHVVFVGFLSRAPPPASSWRQLCLSALRARANAQPFSRVACSHLSRSCPGLLLSSIRISSH